MLPGKLLKMQSLVEFIKRPSQRKCKIAFDKKSETKTDDSCQRCSEYQGFVDEKGRAMGCDAMRPLVLLSCQYCKLHKWSISGLGLCSCSRLPSHTIWISIYLISSVCPTWVHPRRSKNFPYSLSATLTHCVYVMACERAVPQWFGWEVLAWKA